MRHDKINEARRGEVFYGYWDGEYNIGKRALNGWAYYHYARAHEEIYAREICELFKKYEEAE